MFTNILLGLILVSLVIIGIVNKPIKITIKHDYGEPKEVVRIESSPAENAEAPVEASTESKEADKLTKRDVAAAIQEIFIDITESEDGNNG